ncbi:MAG: hypothetical protein J0L55_03205 [Caulobacterales bacterium]|nr:hypothetical protein [Caulobacterales bacterium]MCA0371740.1 hypothetical protein [Pseudomonadota bacterium]
MSASDTNILDVVIPIVTLFIGLAFGMLSDYLKDKRLLEREREIRDIQFRQDSKIRFNQFQRENLISLQEAIGKLIRATGKGHHEDTIAFKMSGEWKKNVLSEEVDIGFLNSQNLVSMHYVRLHNSEIREISKSLKRLCSEVALAESERVGMKNMMEISRIVEDLEERIGFELRRIDNIEASL